MTLYTVHERGNLRTLVDAANGFIKRTDVPVMPSEQWRVTGFLVAAPFGRLNPVSGPLAAQLARLAELTRGSSAPGHRGLRFANGRPRYYVADYDHGVMRVRMSGIIGVWLASEDASYGN